MVDLIMVDLLTPEQQFTLTDISWEGYETLLNLLSDRPVRVTYNQGCLELMILSYAHERYKKLLARLVETLTEELNIPIEAAGSTTFKRKMNYDFPISEFLMLKPKILQEDQSYTFRSYFEMNAEPEEILADLGYTLLISRLVLPMTAQPLPWATALQQRLERSLQVVSLTSETARRETLVAPILLEVAIQNNAQLRIEYPLNVNHWLKGTLDYLLRSSQNLVVIEAKKDDLTRGFTQLATELIALAQSQGFQTLYGAVTMGDVWRFGKLDAEQKQIIQDIPLFSVPDNLEQLLRILSGILEIHCMGAHARSTTSLTSNDPA